ncbi:hypothetical protein [Pseudobutyrivibrio sp. YE44]|uniref:hypothetical protein n=1 Tax=Pseudobutyrivibrio sp. YE44 TaxID=1520802 RepID=UPI000B84DB18|nr:hypothetical protein [Pseudobutyrivibrio sp. YE44]
MKFRTTTYEGKYYDLSGLSEDDYPVGSEVDVLYLKCLVGYDVRAANYQDGWLLWLFFIFQALPIVAMVGLRIYSTFINPSFHVI